MTYLRMYADCVRRGLRGIGKSKWTLLLPPGYGVGLALLSMLMSLLHLGLVGGFVAALAMDFVFSSLLYFIREAVLGTPAKPHELQKSFLAYFWSVVSFGFVIWIVSTILGMALTDNPKGPQIEMAIFGVAAVLLNAVPEVIYQKSSTGGLAIIQESVQFIQRYWIEWFIPNLLLFAALWAALQGWERLTAEVLLRAPMAVVPMAFAGWMLSLTGVYVIGVVRGVLFDVLNTTSAFNLKTRYGRKRN